MSVQNISSLFVRDFAFHLWHVGSFKAALEQIKTSILVVSIIVHSLVKW